MPLFSIITPVYNNERYVRSAADSILGQSFKDLEYIIVDDGSTDHTPQIVDEIGRNDNKVRVIHQKNQWIYASFNTGINAARGEYIYIVNSDDRLRPGILEIMAEKVKLFHPDVIWTKVLTHRCDEHQKIIAYDYKNKDIKITQEMFFGTTDEVRRAWHMFLELGLTRTQANLYRRELIVNHPYRNDVYGADTLYNISIASDVTSAVVLKEAAYDHFNYSRPEMNASIGHYYGYEYEMFKEIYLKTKELFVKWGYYDQKAKQALSASHLSEVTLTLRSFNSNGCDMTLDQKLEKVFTQVIDQETYDCAVEGDKTEELEARVLSALREIFIKEIPSPKSRYYFSFELVESLLRYEKTAEDYMKIENAIYHPLNKYQIGQSFYKKLHRESVINYL